MGASRCSSPESESSLASSVATSMPYMKLDLFGAADEDNDSCPASSAVTKKPAAPRPLSEHGGVDDGSMRAVAPRSRYPLKQKSDRWLAWSCHSHRSELAQVVKRKLELAQKKGSYHAGSKHVSTTKSGDTSSAAPNAQPGCVPPPHPANSSHLVDRQMCNDVCSDEAQEKVCSQGSSDRSPSIVVSSQPRQLQDAFHLFPI